MQGLPVNLQIAFLSANTNAVAGTVTNHVNVILAPGPNLRIRLWGAHLGSPTTRTGTLLNILEDGGGGNPKAYLNAAVGNDTEWASIPGGLVMLDNTSLQVSSQSNAATQPFRLTVYYTIEPT